MKTQAILQGSVLTAFAAAVLLSPGAVGQDERIESTRTVLQERLEIERIISKEKLDWAVGKELLQSRIDLTERQIAGFREDIEGAKLGAADLDKQKLELIAKNDKLKEATQSLAGMITELEQRTIALVAQLPLGLQERVKPLSQRIPEDPENTESSLSERYMNVVGVLNQVNKFNRNVNTASELRTLEDGSTVNVTAIYVGLGAAYYVNSAGDTAGIGHPTPNGWEWESADEHAEAIAKALAIFRNEVVAEYVQLPIRID